ncbi:hypothetical protein SAMN02744778_03153 [Pantoea sp. GL120224-02]|nr:hypothetical protein SAMN02744778_03153 [Pantoea sp. GL120224-02]
MVHQFTPVRGGTMEHASVCDMIALDADEKIAPQRLSENALTDNPTQRHMCRAVAHMIDYIGIVAHQHHGQSVILLQIVE